MGQIIVNKKMLNDALYSGYKFLENNKISNGIKYLEFVYENSIEEDSYLNYALITAYYNVGSLEKANSILELTNIEMIDNITIRETLNQIYREINRTDIKEEVDEKEKNTDKKEYLLYNKLVEKSNLKDETLASIKKFNETINFIKKDLVIEQKNFVLYNNIKKPIISKYVGENAIYSMLIDINNDKVEEEIAEFEKTGYFNEYLGELANSTQKFKDFFINYIENKNSENLLNIIKEITKGKSDSLFLYQGLKSGIFSEIFVDDEVSYEFKEELFHFLTINYVNSYFEKSLFKKCFEEVEDLTFLEAYKKYDEVEKEIENFTEEEKANFIFEEFNKKK